MKAQTKIVVGLATAAAAGLGLAAAARVTGCAPLGPPGPPGPRPRKALPVRRCPPGPRPAELAPDELWVSRDCDAWDVGASWDFDVATPAMLNWYRAGWTDRNRYDHHTVVRSILAPYVRCIDAWPWLDLVAPDKMPPPDEWHRSWLEVNDRYPQVGRLIELLFASYAAILSGIRTE